MSRAKAWLLTGCVAASVVAVFFAGRFFEGYLNHSANLARYALEVTSLPGDYAPGYCLTGSAGIVHSMEQTVLVITDYQSDREALLEEISRTDDWHVAQVSAREYRDFADAALWWQAEEVFQVRDDTCFDAWYYRETAEPCDPPALPDGPFAQIGELGRGFQFAAYDAESGLFLYFYQFG